MYKPINGWTKAKILEVIRARPFEEAAYDQDENMCAYLDGDGNKCAIGLFIPDGHEGQHEAGNVLNLLHSYPDIRFLMPLPEDGLEALQKTHDAEAHDSASQPFAGNAKAAMLDWVEKNVEED